MSRCSPGTHTHQLALYRQRILDTPALLDRNVFAATYVAQGPAAANITWRQCQFPQSRVWDDMSMPDTPAN
jgi:hypothetical protein